MASAYMEEGYGESERESGRKDMNIRRGAGYHELKNFTLTVLSLSDEEKSKLRRELGLHT